MKSMNEIVGYTTGVFDMFHIGHLNLIKGAKARCDYLIVGVCTDDLVVSLKNRRPVIPFVERKEIVASIRYVDYVVCQESIDEIGDHDRLRFDMIFKGSDWEGSDKWQRLSQRFASRGVRVEFLPYTKGTSSTILQKYLTSALSENPLN